MRTTIEMTHRQRARLLAIAAARGEKGFSTVVREAIDAYLRQQGERQARVAEALAQRGALDDGDAAELERRVTEIRGRWR